MPVQKEFNFEALGPLNLENIFPHTFTTDGRLSLRELYECCEGFVRAGWQRYLLTTQYIPFDGVLIQVPVFAYKNTSDIGVKNILISGVHGRRESAGPDAIAISVQNIIDSAKKTNESWIVIPMMNPAGRVKDTRYAPHGNSVGDSTRLLGRDGDPTPPEMIAYERFLAPHIIPGYTQVLDLHEDAMDEWPAEQRVEVSPEGIANYMYVIGEQECLALPVTQRILRVFKQFGHVFTGTKTRFGEEVVDGLVQFERDGSIDEWLAFMGCRVVFTPENIVLSEETPNIRTRMLLYRAVISAFMSEE